MNLPTFAEIAAAETLDELQIVTRRIAEARDERIRAIKLAKKSYSIAHCILVKDEVEKRKQFLILGLNRKRCLRLAGEYAEKKGWMCYLVPHNKGDAKKFYFKFYAKVEPELAKQLMEKNKFIQ